MAQIPILERKDTYIIDYPQAVEFAEKQADIFWTDREIALEKDLVDLKSNLTESELHGVTTVLKLFTEYELRVGSDFWTGKMMKMFHRPELHRMFSMFGMVELNIHAPFYSRINELLGLATDEFYTSYINDPVLKARMDSIEALFKLDTDELENKLVVVGGLAIIEGEILYSNFSYLKHFQAEGKNKLNNLVAGINFSVRDENLHNLGGSWLFDTMMQEARHLPAEQFNEMYVWDSLFNFSEQVLKHEERIIDMIFEKGPIRGITPLQMKAFVKHRNSLCREQLGWDGAEKIEYNPIQKWFYRNIQQGRLHDFFSRQGNEYSRDWKESNFTWSTQG